MSFCDIESHFIFSFIGVKAKAIGGTRPQTPAEGRLRPPDPIQKGF
ncbi:MAG TPA: hypothetical protein V6D16_01060 [Candidatus Obscuribacterales bacterium]